ncbi:MAG: DUF2922 domain-containing protein [Clostridiaceae bacterium]
MADKNLTMYFKNEEGSNSSFMVNRVKPDLDQAAITSLMDTIIAKNIFPTVHGDMIGKDHAKVSETLVTEFDFE